MLQMLIAALLRFVCAGCINLLLEGVTPTKWLSFTVQAAGCINLLLEGVCFFLQRIQAVLCGFAVIGYGLADKNQRKGQQHQNNGVTYPPPHSPFDKGIKIVFVHYLLQAPLTEHKSIYLADDPDRAQMVEFAVRQQKIMVTELAAAHAVVQTVIHAAGGHH